MPRQSFNDFLGLGSSGGFPGRGGSQRGRGRGGSRGRGNGNGRGGRGGGRGGSNGRGGGRTVRGGHFGADYSNMSLDYNKVNASSNNYKRMLEPFGPQTPRDTDQRPRETFRGRGRGIRGGIGLGNTTPSSGARTPTTGLGVGSRRHPVVILDGVVTWGGGRAPLFIKAGELFRDGEVDVKDEEDLVKDVVIEDTEDDFGESAPVSSVQSEDEDDPTASGLPSDDEPGNDLDESDDSTVGEDATEPAAMSEDDAPVSVVETRMTVVQAEATPADGDMQVEVVTATAAEILHEPEAATSAPPISDDEGAEDTTIMEDTTADTSDLFFVDTGADTTMPIEQPLYDATTSSAPIGSTSAAPAEDEESIVFRPRLIADPVPSLPSASTSRPEASTDFELSSVYMDPRVAMSRKDKKAAKRAKRASRKSRKRQEARYRQDSDVDWGSDMEAAGVVGVEVDELGERFASAGLNDEEGDAAREEDVDSELDYEAMARFSKGIGFGHGNSGAVGVDVETDSDEYEELPAKGKRPVTDPFKVASSTVDSSDEEDEDDDDDEDDSEEGDDSNVNAFAALQDAYDQQEESPDEDSYFQGNNTWNSEDEASWFAESMEDALDGGAMAASRKERKAVFRAVQNGTFDTELPIAPAKRDKKGSHIPPELRDMWQRDREKKAEKKRQREAMRMALTMAGRKATKLGGKSAAASIAHLLPGSASEVADMFDVSEDDWSGIPTRGGRVALLPLTLRQINVQITTFIADTGKTTLPLPPMDKDTRRKVHMLAELYDLKSKSKGKGNTRFPILIKLARSHMADEDKLERLLAASENAGQAFYKALYARGSGHKGPKGPSGGPSARVRDGETVGEGAEKIGEDNVGHRLLSMMGWSEGAAIGRVGGLDAPITAIVKNTKSGLGA